MIYNHPLYVLFSHFVCCFVACHCISSSSFFFPFFFLLFFLPHKRSSRIPYPMRSLWIEKGLRFSTCRVESCSVWQTTGLSPLCSRPFSASFLPCQSSWIWTATLSGACESYPLVFTSSIATINITITTFTKIIWYLWKS